MAPVILVVAASTASATIIHPAWAPGLVSEGDVISLNQGGYRIAGGEFVVKDASGTPLHNTFCLERNEFFDWGQDLEVRSVTDAAIRGGLGGGNPDPISAETAYLFHNYYFNSLHRYSDSSATTTAEKNAVADGLQKAIWYLEEELTSVSGLAADFVSDARAAVASGAWTGIGGVRVLNLFNAKGGEFAQDQLTVVPEPSALLVWATIGGVFLGGRRIRRKRRAAE